MKHKYFISYAWASYLAVTLVFLLGNQPAHATVALGAGFTSTTSGRQIPAITGALDFGGTTLSGFATGVATPLYSHSGYLLNVTRNLLNGSFLGPVDVSFGGGVYYANRTLRETTTSTIAKEDTFAVGPAFRTVWRPLGPLYFGFDVLIGLRPSTAHIFVSLQDVVSFSIGLEI